MPGADFAQPTISQWNVNVQRQLGRSWLVTTAFRLDVRHLQRPTPHARFGRQVPNGSVHVRGSCDPPTDSSASATITPETTIAASVGWRSGSAAYTGAFDRDVNEPLGGEGCWSLRPHIFAQTEGTPGSTVGPAVCACSRRLRSERPPWLKVWGARRTVSAGTVGNLSMQPAYFDVLMSTRRIVSA